MKNRILYEVVGQVVLDKATMFESMLEDWHGVAFCQLSMLLSATRALSMLHQTHHWLSKSGTFYGDHLLFEKIYDSTNVEIDKIAEKILGFADDAMVDPVTSSEQCTRILKEMMRAPGDLYQKSENAEKAHLQLLTMVRESLDNDGNLSDGTDNMLTGFADQHESNLYLLKRRNLG